MFKRNIIAFFKLFTSPRLTFLAIFSHIVCLFFMVKFYFLGIEKIAEKLFASIKKVSDPNSIFHNCDGFYVSYNDNGIALKSKRCHNILLYIDSHFTSKNSINSYYICLEDILLFKNFYNDIQHYKGYFFFHEKWKINYKNKKITDIICSLNIHTIEIFKFQVIDIIFDADFKPIKILKNDLLITVIDEDTCLDTELLFLKIWLFNSDKMLSELYPESLYPTVYDYSSLEFKRRLNLQRMIDF